jgi:hypothetical protein
MDVVNTDKEEQRKDVKKRNYNSNKEWIKDTLHVKEKERKTEYNEIKEIK